MQLCKRAQKITDKQIKNIPTIKMSHTIFVGVETSKHVISNMCCVTIREDGVKYFVELCLVKSLVFCILLK